MLFITYTALTISLSLTIHKICFEAALFHLVCLQSQLKSEQRCKQHINNNNNSSNNKHNNTCKPLRTHLMHFLLHVSHVNIQYTYE